MFELCIGSWGVWKHKTLWVLIMVSYSFLTLSIYMLYIDMAKYLVHLHMSIFLKGAKKKQE